MKNSLLRGVVAAALPLFLAFGLSGCGGGGGGGSSSSGYVSSENGGGVSQDVSDTPSDPPQSGDSSQGSNLPPQPNPPRQGDSGDDITFTYVTTEKAQAQDYETLNESFSYSKKRGCFVGLNDLDSQFSLAVDFSMVEVGDYAGDYDPEKINFFKDNGIATFGYEWLVAKYHYTDGGKDDPFTEWLLADKATRALNKDGFHPHCEENGWDWCKEYYIDYGNPEVFEKRADDIVLKLSERGLTGVFFDWGNSVWLEESVYAPVKEEWEKRHAETYSSVISHFYSELRRRGVKVISNQAFRDGGELVRSVDYDMSESDMSTDVYLDGSIEVEGRGTVSPIPETLFYWDDSKRFDGLVDRLKEFERYKRDYSPDGFKNFIFVNYAAPNFEKKEDGTYRALPPRGVYYFNYAFAKLIDACEYTEIPFDRSFEEEGNEVYFADIGEPLGTTFHKVSALKEGYLRFYSKGFVLVSNAESQDEVYVLVETDALKGKSRVYDLFSDEVLPVKDGKVVVKISFEYDPVKGDRRPAGRVFLFE